MHTRNIVTFILASVLCTELNAQIAVSADTIYTMAGPAIIKGTILINNGKIEQVGSSSSVTIPQNYKSYSAKVVTPGLVDARSVVGLSGSVNIPTDQDQLEKSSPIQPELRAIDAYNPEELLVSYLRDNGVTTIHTGHGVGALVSGQTMVAKTNKGFISEVTIEPVAMVAMTLGSTVSGNFASPGTKAKQIAMLRTEFIKAQAHLKKMNDKDSTKRPAADIKMDILAKVLKGEAKALISANTSNDIMSAIRLQKEFGFKLVLEGAAEAYRLIDEIKKSGAEVIVHATMARNGGDLVNMTRENAAILAKAGIPISIESGYEAYVPKTRLILFEAAVATAFSLPVEEALKAITINPARLLGLDKRIGSIEKGKDADLVLYNGEPFEYLTKVCTVIINGQVVAEKCR